MTCRSAIVALGLIVGALGACFSPVPIEGATCPCPSGYCCENKVCVRRATCGSAFGTDASSGAGGGGAGTAGAGAGATSTNGSAGQTDAARDVSRLDGPPMDGGRSDRGQQDGIGGSGATGGIAGGGGGGATGGIAGGGGGGATAGVAGGGGGGATAGVAGGGGGGATAGVAGGGGGGATAGVAGGGGGGATAGVAGGGGGGGGATGGVAGGGDGGATRGIAGGGGIAENYPDTATYHGGPVMSPNIRCLLWTPTWDTYSSTDIQARQDYITGIQQYLSNAAAVVGTDGAGAEPVPRQYGIWGATFSGTCQQDTTAPFQGAYLDFTDNSQNSAIYHEITNVYGSGAFTQDDVILVITRGWTYKPGGNTNPGHWSVPGTIDYMAAIDEDYADYGFAAHELIEAATIPTARVAGTRIRSIVRLGTRLQTMRAVVPKLRFRLPWPTASVPPANRLTTPDWSMTSTGRMSLGPAVSTTRTRVRPLVPRINAATSWATTRSRT